MIKFFKKFILIFLSFFYPRTGNTGSVLMYHSIGFNPLFSTVLQKEFERQMEYLHINNYEVISLVRMYEKLELKENIKGCVVLTFDDGYYDFYTSAVPVLKKYHFAATVFLVTGSVDGEASFMDTYPLSLLSESQIKELSGTGFIDFMPHTVTHPNLDKTSYQESISEIEGSRVAVESLTGRPANIFAYPRGRYTYEIYSYLSSSRNWLGAVSVIPGHVEVGDDGFILKRISIDRETSFTLFRIKLSPAYDAYEKLKKWCHSCYRLKSNE